MTEQSRQSRIRGPGAGLLAILWAIVVLELVLPVPGPLTLGAAWVLLARPAWFARLVRELYPGDA